MRQSTKITALFISLFSTMASEGEAAAKNVSGRQAIQIIKYVNDEDGYWHQKRSKIHSPVPNMGPRRTPSLIDCTEDVIKAGLWSKAFVAFILKAAEQSSLLTIYVEDGPFGLAPIFSIRRFNLFKKSSYLLKFQRPNLSKEQYEHMIKILYSKNNVVKHAMFRLEKREPLIRYEY